MVIFMRFVNILAVGIMFIGGMCHDCQAEPSQKPGNPEVRNYTRYDAPSDLTGRERSELAFKMKQTEVAGLFQEAGIAFPPRDLLFLVYKDENRLEVWARGKGEDKMSQVTSYGICYASGTAGPKRRQGDGQVPEGFYTLDYFKNSSDFFLAMRVSYPNKADRILAHGSPGSAIMIHGSCVSIGCLAMSDERIMELWVMATSMKRQSKKVNVWIFPSRDLDELIRNNQDSPHRHFWENLKTGLDLFRKSGKLMSVTVDSKGNYLFR